MKLLVTGTTGQLAQSLLEAGLSAGADVTAIRRPQLDLSIPATIRRAIERSEADIVVNAAAYTAVDQAETDEVAAHAVNATGAGELAAACANKGVPLIHISTDYVFDGTKSAPYVESDPTCPCNAYGRSKLAGERAVASAAPRHVILRTAWVHSPFGNNFVKTMLRLSATRSQLDVVDDQLGCPTYAPHLAASILAIARRTIGADTEDPCWGTYHAAGAGETSWCGFAREIFSLSSGRAGPSALVNPIGTAQYPTAATRPANARLDCGKLQQVFGAALPHWRDGLRAAIERLVPVP